MIADLIQFKSIQEMDPQPTRWSEVMEALLAQAITHDEIEPLLRIAVDRAEAWGEVNDPLYWGIFTKDIDDVIKALEVCQSPDRMAPILRSFLIALGNCADQWETQAKFYADDNLSAEDDLS